MNLLEPLVRRPLFAEMSCSMNGCCQPKSAAIGSWAHCPRISVFGRLGTKRRQPQWSVKQQRPEWEWEWEWHGMSSKTNVSPMFLHLSDSQRFPSWSQKKSGKTMRKTNGANGIPPQRQHGHDRQAVQDAGQSLLSWSLLRGSMVF